MNNTPTPQVGKRLQMLRAMVEKLSAREVDRLAGIEGNHIRALETRSGDHAQIDTIARYAGVYGVTPAWLAFGDGPDPSPDDVKAAVALARSKRPPAEAVA